MLLKQLFKPTDENYQLLKEFNETPKEVVIKGSSGIWSDKYIKYEKKPL